MSYHIVSIDEPESSLSCKDGQLTCRNTAGAKSLPLEDVACIVVTSFSTVIHSSLLLEAAKHGIGLIICESYKPISLVLPANRATDTFLIRAQAYISAQLRQRLWTKTLDAKCANQHALAAAFGNEDPKVEQLARLATRRSSSREAECAKLFWRIFATHVAETDDFRRGRTEGGPNCLLNYGYAVLLSLVLQLLFAVGLDPTFGISHATRANSTPLAYDIMEQFRICVDQRVAMWIRNHPGTTEWEVTKEFRQWITAFALEPTEWEGTLMPVRGAIEAVVRSFRQAVTTGQSGPYKTWTQTLTKWDG